jgi:CheY-like chemotaxis protein
LAAIYGDNLIEKGDPAETLEKFKQIHGRFFDFEGFDINFSGDNKAFIVVDQAFGALEVEGYCSQMLGGFERLIELTGAGRVKAGFFNKSWEGEGNTIIEIVWGKAEPRSAEDLEARKKVMVIDDDENTCRMAQIALSKLGFEVMTRTSGLGTSSAIRSFKPELVLLDVMMPGISGDSLAEVIDQRIKPRPKIVFFSNKNAEELQTLVKKHGVEGYVCKVDGPTALVKYIEKVLEK